jgi:hypothetical protein
MRKTLSDNRLEKDAAMAAILRLYRGGTSLFAGAGAKWRGRA